MPTPKLKREILEETYNIYVECGESQSKTASIMGLSRGAVQDRLRAYNALDTGEDTDTIVMPSFVLHGDEEEDITSILDRKAKNFERKLRAHSERDWFKIKVKESKPYAIIAFGDPHLDDDGANIPLLRKHLDIASRPGVYAINIGDVHNNWVGRLERLYGHQETSRKTGRRLVEWFMWESGAKWLCFILGNHDSWAEGSDFIIRLAQNRIPVIDWKAQFALEHASGSSCRIDASHGRKGTSQWNALHATLKAAKLGELADIYFTGHTHNYGCEDLEIAERKHSAWLVQLRGYKFFDSHALYNNFAEYQRGSAVMTIIDPRKGAKRVAVQCFEDIELGYRTLEMLRG